MGITAQVVDKKRNGKTVKWTHSIATGYHRGGGEGQEGERLTRVDPGLLGLVGDESLQLELVLLVEPGEV